MVSMSDVDPRYFEAFSYRELQDIFRGILYGRNADPESEEYRNAVEILKQRRQQEEG